MLCKHGDLSSDPQHSCKIWAYACGHTADQSVQPTVSSKFKHKVESNRGRHLTLTSGLYMQVHTYLHTCLHTHEHKHTHKVNAINLEFRIPTSIISLCVISDCSHAITVPLNDPIEAQDWWLLGLNPAVSLLFLTNAEQTFALKIWALHRASWLSLPGVLSPVIHPSWASCQLTAELFGINCQSWLWTFAQAGSPACSCCLLCLLVADHLSCKT